MMTINGEEEAGFSSLQTPLVDNLTRFEGACEKINENFEMLKEYIEILVEYKAKIAAGQIDKSMRRRMNTEITEGNDFMKRIYEDLQELENFKFKRRKDIENFNKTIRKFHHIYEDLSEKFTKLLKEIHQTETKQLEYRKSSLATSHDPSVQSNITASDRNTVKEQENQESVEETTHNLEIYASIIEERENAFENIRKLAAEMNLLAQAQHQKIQDHVVDLENLVDNTSEAEKDTENANKELGSTLKEQEKITKKNLVFVVLIVFLCILILSIVFSTLT